jgi:hypothetical protein
MIMRSHLCLIVGLACLLELDAAPPAKLEGYGVLYTRTIRKLGRQEFTQWAVGLLGERIHVGLVAVYPTRIDQVLAGPPGGDHCSFEERQARVAANALPQGECPAISEVIKIGSGRTLREVNRRCQVNQTVLTGKENPLVRTLSSLRAEIVDISVVSGKPQMQIGSSLVTFYIRVPTGNVTEAAARSLVNDLRPLVQPLDISVVIRSDTYFVDQCGFPTIYGFAIDSAQPLTKENYLRGKEMGCSLFAPWPVRCVSIR